MRRLLPYLRYLRPVRAEFATAVIYGIVFGVTSGFGLPFMLQKVFPVVFHSTGGGLTLLELLSFAALLPSVFLLRAISGFRNSYLISLCGTRVLEQLRMDYFRKLQVLPIGFFQSHSTGDLLARGIDDTNRLQAAITAIANEAIKQPATLISALGALVYLSIQNQNVVFMLLCLGLVPVSVFPIRMVGKNLLKRARQMQEQIGDVTSLFAENLASPREIRAYGLEEREINRFNSSVKSLFGYQLKVVKYAQLLSPTIEFLASVGIAVALVYAYRVSLPWETFLAMTGALYMSYEPIKKMGWINSELKRAQSSLDRLESVLHEPVTITDPPHPRDLSYPRGDIRFENVTFTYASDVPALRDVSITIPAGTVCALVGPSGAGKSTFANLVPRFYEAQEGRVTIDNLDVRDVRLSDLRRHLAIVSQEPVLFNDTVLENLRLGQQDATREEIEQAARNAFAHEFILTLPRGYDTIVGERGASLSGGQRQRIALARAFLRDAPILILDEATSALDSESEAAVQQALERLVIGKTVLIIAHRFSTIRAASLILVFDQGRIVASGSHVELHATNPLYRSLYDRQHQSNET